MAREFAAHLCPIVDACACDQALDDCEQLVVDRVGRWEQGAIDLGLTLDEACLDLALQTIDGFAECGREWFGDCYVYSGAAGVGEPCERVDDLGLMSKCAPGLFCRGGICGEESEPTLDVGEQCATSPDGIIPVAPNGGFCREPLKCDWMGSMVCVETSPTGATCTAEVECAIGDFCRASSPDVVPTEANPGVCTTRTKNRGEACEYANECVDTLCVDGTCHEFSEPPPTPLLCDMVGVISLASDGG